MFTVETIHSQAVVALSVRGLFVFETYMHFRLVLSFFSNEKKDKLSFLKAGLSSMHVKALAPQKHILKCNKHFPQQFWKFLSTRNMLVGCLVGWLFFFSWHINLEIPVCAVQRDIQQEIPKFSTRETIWIAHSVHIQSEFSLLVGVPLMSIENTS